MSKTNLYSIFKTLFLGVSVLVLGTSLAISDIQAISAEYYEGENVQIESTSQNVYAAGDNIILNNPIAKDAVIAGRDVEVTEAVGRSLIIIGKDIEIDTRAVRGAVRIAGQDIKISGNFGEEVIIVGQSVEIIDANIVGDLTVSGSYLKMEGSRVQGDAYIATGRIEGSDLEDQVQGEVEKIKSKSTGSFWLNLYVQISVIIALILLGFILVRNRNYLLYKKTKLNKDFGKDILNVTTFYINILPMWSINDVVI